MDIALHNLVVDDYYYHEVSAKLTDPNARDDSEYTLLHLAAMSTIINNRIVHLLISRGADVNSTTPQGNTPLHFAASARKRNAIFSLTEAGASLNAKDHLGRTALHFAIGGKSNNPLLVPNTDVDNRIVKWLSVLPDIDMNPVDCNGETPLMWAVKEQNVEAVKVLLKYGANPNIPSTGKRTPLHEALSAEIVTQDIPFVLLMMGAGIYCADHSEQTPVDILVRRVITDVNGNDDSFQFSFCCIILIALQYQVKESLKTKLQPKPGYSAFLDQCSREISLMKRLFIYGKFTMHDFALNCFEEQVEDPALRIYTLIVEVLLCGFFEVYFHFLLLRFSRSDLYKVLDIAVGSENSYYLPTDASRLTIYCEIRYYYESSVILMRHLRRLKKFVNSKI